MIESVEFAIQLVVSGLCSAIAGYRAIVTQQKTWLLLTLFYSCFFLGDLYWQLYLFFYHHTGQFSYISEPCWYAGYLFLFLLLQEMKRQHWPRYKVLWLIPVFTVSMCVFYMQRGDYFSNLVTVLLMTLLLWHAVKGLLFLRGSGDGRRWLYVATLVFCLAEYTAWTASCFWLGDTLTNPYFWCDFLLTVCLIIFLPALRKAVEG